MGVRIFDTDDNFNDSEIESATEIIRQSLTGELTTEGLQSIPGVWRLNEGQNAGGKHPVERGCRSMMTLAKLKWVIPALATIASAIAIGCSSEPVVVEKIVEKEVVVTTTSIPAQQPMYTPLPTPTPSPTAAPRSNTALIPPPRPAATPTPVSKDYYVVIQGIFIEYYVDFPSHNQYFAKRGGMYSDFSNPELFLGYLLKEGVVTPEQKRSYSSGGWIKIPLNKISLAIYKGLQFKGYHGMKIDFGLEEWELESLLYHFDESMLDSGSNHPGSDNSFDAASVLARFSTPDPAEGEQRADAVGEIIAQYKSGKADASRVLDLLHTVAPELSVDERRRAADELARLSEDDEWDEAETAEGVFYLAALVTGDEPNPGERIEAAHEMVVLYEVGELDAGTALDLMNTVAPGLSINHRRQAAEALARLSADDDWDDTDRMEAASEVFRLVTGVPLDAEARMGAAVDLTGVGMKILTGTTHSRTGT